MRVLYVNRPNCLVKIGGDTVQMLKTKEYLEKQFGITITICDDVNDLACFRDCDVVHMFNIQGADHTRAALEQCKRAKKKAALSTIFWDMGSASYVSMLYKALRLKPSPFAAKAEVAGHLLGTLAYGLVRGKSNVMFIKKHVARQILLDVDYLLPNSHEELELLSRVFNLDLAVLTRKATVVPNAVDVERVVGGPDAPTDLKGYVLQVARIEPVKNQLNVVRALFKFRDIPIVFVGRSGDDRYFLDVKKVAEKRGNVFFLGEVPNDQVYGFYRRAACHVLPSFRESPGLVSLEALMCNVPIVVSDSRFCPTQYYQFDKYGYICDPYSTLSIRAAVLSAIEKGPKAEVGTDYRYFYSYANVANKTFEVYRSLV